MKWVLVRLKVVHDENGRPRRLLGSTMDITSATLNDEKRRASEELFQSLATYAPIGIAEAMGFGWVRSIHPLDAKRVTSEWIEATTNDRS